MTTSDKHYNTCFVLPNVGKVEKVMYLAHVVKHNLRLFHTTLTARFLSQFQTIVNVSQQHSSRLRHYNRTVLNVSQLSNRLRY
jgi:hypothetical protein